MSEGAEGALKARIEHLAKRATTDQVVKLADAYSKIEYGPQGGSVTGNYDYHKPPSRPTGFRP